MGLLPYLLCSVGLLAVRQVPQGTRLDIRLTTTVGSYASKPGSPVRAVLIAPVSVDGELLLPAGSTLMGRVKSVRRVGYGILHETAAIDLEFNSITTPGDETIPISVRVTAVDNGRERVEKNGMISGVRSTGSPAYRLSGYLRAGLMFSVHAQIAVWAVKMLLVQVPEPEIYYPAGVELGLTLTRPLPVRSREEDSNAPRLLTQDERDLLGDLIADVPVRTSTVKNRPSDLINMMFLGSRQQITAAFKAAGWSETPRATMRTHLAGIRAVVESRGYHSAPMTPLLLNDVEADMSWQKGLNDMSKRHHIRIWKQEGTYNGQEIWVGAATRDIDFAFLRPGQAITHRIDGNVDQERDKIAHDLAYTSYVDVLDWTERSGVPSLTRNGTGDLMSTDTRIAIVRFCDTDSPRLSTETTDTEALAMHGKTIQRFFRREILAARSDLIRRNFYWRGYESVRWMVTEWRKRNQPPEVADVAPNMPFTRFVALR